MISLAASWDLYTQTHSALVLGNVGLVQVAPFLLFSLYAGHIADRHDRRLILVVTQAVYLLASGLLLFSHGSVPLIYACLGLTALARTFQWPARGALLPQIVPAGSIGSAVTWSSSAQEISSVSGPALAGLLLAGTGTRTVYLLQVAFAALSLIFFLSIRSRRAANAHQPERTLRSMLEGLRFVFADKLILTAISLDLFGVLFGGATALLPIFAADILHAGPRELGWLRAAPSLGAVAMALGLAHTPRIDRAGRALLLAVAGFGAATIGFGLSRNLWLSLAFLLLTGAFDNVSVVLRQSLLQSKPPDAVRGRVLSVSAIFISCSNQLGAVESGWTAAWLGASASVWGGGLATIAVVMVCAAATPALRRWRQGAAPQSD